MQTNAVYDRQRRGGNWRVRRATRIGDGSCEGLVVTNRERPSRSRVGRGIRPLPVPAERPTEEPGAGAGLGRGELLGPACPLDHNSEESRYSSYVRDALLQLLRGSRDQLDLLVKYHREPNRLGILAVPPAIDARALRPPQAEVILHSALRFLHDGSAGGPVSLSEDHTQGTIAQIQDFPTRFPHVVIQRTDSYDAATGEPMKSSWSVLRLQNQQSSIHTNRTLDALNLGVEILKIVL